MVDVNTLLLFSHTHCIAICAVLVPVNLMATVQTLLLTGFGRARTERHGSIAVASLAAILMILHVLTWLVVGVVRVPTYILFSLGTVCLGVNLWALAFPDTVNRLLGWLGRSLKTVMS